MNHNNSHYYRIHMSIPRGLTSRRVARPRAQVPPASAARMVAVGAASPNDFEVYAAACQWSPQQLAGARLTLPNLPGRYCSTELTSELTHTYLQTSSRPPCGCPSPHPQLRSRRRHRQLRPRAPRQHHRDQHEQQRMRRRAATRLTRARLSVSVSKFSGACSAR